MPVGLEFEFKFDTLSMPMPCALTWAFCFMKLRSRPDLDVYPLHIVFEVTLIWTHAEETTGYSCSVQRRQCFFDTCNLYADPSAQGKSRNGKLTE